MADKNNKYPENADGAYFVDTQCTACGLCVETAPENFAFTDDEDHVYVSKQPTTDTEISNCDESIESCPADAIGKDA